MKIVKLVLSEQEKTELEYLQFLPDPFGKKFHLFPHNPLTILSGLFSSSESAPDFPRATFAC